MQNVHSLAQVFEFCDVAFEDVDSFLGSDGSAFELDDIGAQLG